MQRGSEVSVIWRRNCFVGNRAIGGTSMLAGKVVKTYAKRAPSFPVEELPPPQADSGSDEDEVLKQ